MRRGLMLLIALVVPGCLQDATQTCADGTLCPDGFVCLAAGGCVSTVQQAACDGLVDGDRCAYAGVASGTCAGGACVAASCGNLIVDELEGCDEGDANANTPDASCRTDCQPPRCGDAIVDALAGELCDDGNRTPGDGCDFDCGSLEVCGNDRVDFAAGELCDDGNTTSHDGCSARCLVERPTWTRLDAEPSRNSDAVMAFDAARGEVVMFGGQRDDTWIWDGSAWQIRDVAGERPATRSQPAMAYDPVREVVVMFGGYRPTGFRDDTWEWDGVSWTEHNVAVHPPARWVGAMAYDAARHVMVLFGGADDFNLNATFDDTWLWDGASWVQASPGNAPSPRTSPALSGHDAAGHVVLFGGRDSNGTALGDTWLWDGTTWTAYGGAAPPARFGAGAVYFASRGEVFMTGGPSADAWRWSGTSWSQASDPDERIRPSQRRYLALAYDAARDEAILFGGAGFSALGETWRWDGTSWSTPRPPARQAAALAYDEARGRAVMFGGHDHERALGDTWEWDGTVWIRHSPPDAPSRRSGACMTYDRARGVTLLFGGVNYADQYYDDTWTWDGTTWTDRSDGDRPVRRSACGLASDGAGTVLMAGGYANGTIVDTQAWDGTSWTQQPAPLLEHGSGVALAFDEVAHQFRLFGGYSSGAATYSDVTYRWDGADWLADTFEDGPVGRADMAVAYARDAGGVVIFGGGKLDGPLDETWALDGRGWQRYRSDDQPSARLAPAATHVGVAQGTLLFGGLSSNSVPLADEWLFRLDDGSGAADEACAAAVDTDGDGTAGCADLDCWASCQPACAPAAAAADACAASDGSTCGDGTCDPLETAVACPADCP